MVFARFRKQQEPSRNEPPPEPWRLDDPLLMLSPTDPFTIRHSFEGIGIFGSIGSGKTSGSLRAIVMSMLAAGYGGLVHCASSEDASLWERWAEETGRSGDLLTIEPGGPWRLNFLEYEASRQGGGAGQVENLLKLIVSCIEISQNKVRQAGGDDFWMDNAEQMVRACLIMLLQAKQLLSVDALSKMIAEAPQNDEDVGSPHWRGTSFTAHIIRAAEERLKQQKESGELSPREAMRQQHDFDVALEYWLRTFPRMADKTRSGVIATFMGFASVLAQGIAWDLLGTDTTLVPEVTYKAGAIILLKLPINEYGPTGRLVQGIWKLMFQMCMLRRPLDRDPRPTFLVADEAQTFISRLDFTYQAQVRKFRSATIYASQNINNYAAVLGAGSDANVDALLGNLVTKILHAQSDHKTNTWASTTIGKAWTTREGETVGIGPDGQPTITRSQNPHEDWIVPPLVFTSLRTGGHMNGGQVDAIVYKGGHTWRATGASFLPVIFQQS